MKKCYSFFLCLASTMLLASFSYAQTGNIVTIAGCDTPGYSGDGGPATIAKLSNPVGIAVDAAGNVYFADNNSHVVRKISTTGIITNFAGNGAVSFSGDNGPATDAALQFPSGLAFDAAGNLYIADTWNHRIRKVNTSGIITTFAGNGIAGFSSDGYPATIAEINMPASVAFDRLGNLFIADYANHRIRKVNSAGNISTVAGIGTPGYSGDDSLATAAHLQNPTDVAVDSRGFIYIADFGNRKIRKVNDSGIITTLVPSTAIDSAFGLTVDSTNNLFVAALAGGRIYKVDTSGISTVIAGNGSSGYSGDHGPATNAQLYNPNDIAIGSAGEIFISDNGNARVRKVYSTVGIENLNSILSGLKVSPNPTTGFFTVNFYSNIAEVANISVTNLLGQKMMELKLAANQSHEIINSLPSGIYFITANTTHGKYIDRIVITK